MVSEINNKATKPLRSGKLSGIVTSLEASLHRRICSIQTEAQATGEANDGLLLRA
jgi:hypothetical protein